MAMTPEEQKRFTELENLVKSILRVENVSFIENGKRRIAKPLLGDGLQKDTTGNTSGMTKFVNEGGVSTYSVAKAFTGSITIEDSLGNTYKLGYY